MRTKALFSAAAALAVSAVVAQAQVYSVNIVGYVNQATTGGQLHLIQNPLDDGTNTLNSVLGDAPNTSEAWVWNGSGYTPALKSGKTGLWPAVGIPTGVGFFFRPPSDHTNTYVGEVLAGPGGSVTNSLVGGQVDLTGSLLPIGTSDISTDANFGLTQAPNTSELWKWNGTGYTPALKSGKTGLWPAGIGIDVAESFFLKPPSNFDWVQSLP